LSDTETAVGEVELDHRSHELADPESGDHLNHASLIGTGGQPVIGPTTVVTRWYPSNGASLERSMADVYRDL
jgi:hypothetical protein